MNFVERISSSLIAFALCAITGPAHALDPQPTADGAGLSWQGEPGQTHQLRVMSPDGSVDIHDFAPDQVIMIQRPTVEGRYAYELRSHAPVDDMQRSAALAARENGKELAATPDTGIRNGGFLIEADGLALESQKDAVTGMNASDSDIPAAPRSTRDQVIADDLIVQGSACVGIDCVNGENLTFQTLKVKHNNPRLRFEDTSASVGFTTRDWAITANDNLANGLDFLAFSDIDAGTNPFWVQSDSRNNALVVNGNRIGFGTATPAIDLHYVDLDTPTLRMEQSNAGGFVAQTWDVAGNEANFFIRDVTSGSLLPFRIRPGAPTSSIDIRANGNVGIGRDVADARLDLYRAAGDQPLLRARTGMPGSEVTQLQLEANGNLRVNGTISQLSSRAAKTNFVSIDPSNVLAAVTDLPITFWNYLHQDAGVRHLGPTAEDFHAAFGLGERPTEIAPGDLAGVALAAIQALNQEVAERDRRIEDLEARLQRLETRLTGDSAVNER